VDWVVVRTDAYDHLQPAVNRLMAADEFTIVYDTAPVLILRRSD